MPFDLDNPIPGGTIGVGVHDAPDPSFLETLGASFRQENLIGSGLANARIAAQSPKYHDVDLAYNVFDDIQGYEENAKAGAFDEVYNQTAAQAVKAQIDQERKDRKILDASGWTGFSMQAIASMLDPTIFIPGGALAKAGKVGYSLGRSALIVGGAAAGATAVQELGLQATQETRPLSESAINIGGTAILGAFIGMAGAKFFSKAEWDRVGSKLAEELAGEVENPAAVTDIIVKRMQSVGASAVEEIKIDDLGVGGPKVAKAIATATAAARINPGIQTMLSPSVSVRETYARLVDNPIYTTMNMEGRTLGASVENLVKQTQRGAMGKWLTEANDIWRKARKDGFSGRKTEFFEAVAKAGRRGDIDPSGNEHVTRLAQRARADVFDPLLERAKRAGLLPEDVKVTTAASYVTRMWNRQRLIAKENEFREIARQYFGGELAKVSDGKKPAFVSKADLDDYIDEAVTAVFSNLTGRAKADDLLPDWIVPLKRGPLKERTFNIPDKLVEDFLENDMELILRNYTRKMGADIELTEKFGRADLRDQLEAINLEYDGLSAAAKTEKERIKLDADRKRDLKNLTAFRDMIRGTYRAAEEGSEWSKLTRAALTWNYMRLLGGVTMTSLSDAARLLGVHGIRATMSEALPALVSNLKAVKIAKQDARDLGAVTEVILQSRLASLTDIQDPYRYGSSYERFLSNSSNIFTKATGLSYWNDTMKTAASVMTQNRMARNVLTATEGRPAPSPAAPQVTAESFYRRSGKTLDDIYASAGKWQGDLEGVGAEIAKATGAEFKSSGLKARETSEAKVARKGYDDASELTDIIRGGFAVKTPEQADEVIARLAERYDVLDEGWLVRPDGYSDRKALVRFDDGTIGEIQLWEPQLLHAKENGGHDLYELSRQLPYGSPEHTAIRNQMIDLYAAARREAGLDWSSVGSSSGPKLLKRSRQASSDMTPPELETSWGSTETHSAPGFKTALASDLPSTAGRPSQLRKSIANSLDESVSRPSVGSNTSYGKLDKAERAYMAYLGIDENMAERIADQIRAHGVQERNIWGANVSTWTDDGARRTWAAALNKDVDRTIVTKGVGDTPLWMKTNWGRLIMQFKSFGLASHQRVLISGLQERPHRLAEQMVLATTIGMMVGYLKYMERGDVEEANRLLNNPGLWIADGLDRTGILALPFEISNTAEKLGSPVGIISGAQLLAGDEDKGGQASRYASRNKLGAVAGPWAGIFEDLSTIAEQLGEGDLKKSGANALIRQFPGATLPGVRSAIHIGVKPALHDAVD